MDGKIYARLHLQNLDTILRRKRFSKIRWSSSRLDDSSIWLEPASVHITYRRFSAAFSTRQNLRPINRRVSAVCFPLHRFNHSYYPWLNWNNHCQRNRTRCFNSWLSFEFLRQQPQSNGQVIRQRHETVRPNVCILPVRIKSVILRCSLLLSFHRLWRPPSAWSWIKTSRTPQRCRPSHVNSNATSPIISNGSGGRRNLLRLSKFRPSTQHGHWPWSRPWSSPDNNVEWMPWRHFKQHRQTRKVEGYGHAILLDKM